MAWTIARWLPRSSAGQPVEVDQVAHPVRKGVGDSVQTGGGSANVFTITQTSKQDNDTGSGQTNVVQGDCHTEGNCTVEQTTTVQGDTTTNTQSGQDIDTTTTCAGTGLAP